MKKNSPLLTYLGAVALVASLAMVAAFAAVISWFDMVCFGFVLLVFLWFCRKLFNLLERKGAMAAVAVLVFLGSIFLFHNLYLYVISLPSGSTWKILAVLAALSLVGTVGVVAGTERLGGRRAMAAAAVLGLLVPAYPVYMAQGENAQSQGVRQTSLAENAVDPAYNVAKYTRPIIFKRKPNVYLLGLSAGTAESILKAHLGLEQSPLSAYMREAGFRTFHNVFTEAQLTRMAYDLILSMHRDLYFTLSSKDRGTMLSGNIPSPLYTIFRDNGYEVSTLAEAAKFGIKGAFVDRYEVAVEASLCNFHFLPHDIKSTMFLGGCDVRKLFNRWSKEKSESIFDFQIARLEEIKQSDKPQLVFLHMRPPYHYRGEKMAGPDFDKVASFKAQSEKFLAQAAENLRRVMDEIVKDDPSAIVLAFGDHGLSLSATPSNGELNDFFVKDRYAVLGGVHPANACADYFPKAGEYPFVTTSQLVSDLVSCLSEGGDPYPPGYSHLGIFGQETFDFAPYAYEPVEGR